MSDNYNSVDYREPQAEQAAPDQVDESSLDRKERDERVIHYFQRVFHILNAYQTHQTTAQELRMSLKSMQLALGFTLCAGADNPAELARSLGISKQTVGKCLNHFIAQLKLSPLPGQCATEARENMSKAREKQLKKL